MIRVDSARPWSGRPHQRVLGAVGKGRRGTKKRGANAPLMMDLESGTPSWIRTKDQKIKSLRCFWVSMTYD